ncbi:MAG TPA: DnaJ domain-containing protein [bacterium]
MEKEQNFYEILEVPFGASDEDIKDNYKELSKKHHPDNFQSSREKENAHEKMIKINAAKETLLNQQKRKEYDERIKPALHYEQELNSSLSDDYDVEKKLHDLWKWIRNFQNVAVDTAKASYFAQDHQKSRLAEPRDGAIRDDFFIRRRQRKW